MGLQRNGGGDDEGGRNRKDKKDANKKGGEEGRRVQRVEREIREVIATFLISGFRGELQGLVSVSRVQITKDLRQGYVYISVLGSPGDADASLEVLEENAFDVQNEISRKLKMKFCPKLKFFLDESMDSVIKVEKILRDISIANSSGKVADKKIGPAHVDDSSEAPDEESDEQ